MAATDFAFRIDPAVDVRRSLVVVGTPTIGLVGVITAHHMVQALGMKQVGSIASTAFPPMFYVRKGRLSPPVRIFAAEAECGGGLACDRVIVITTEFRPQTSLFGRLSDAIMTWARENECPLVVIPDGIPADDDEEQTDVFGVASSDAAHPILDALKVEPFPEGILAGLSGTLMDAAQRRDVNAVCVLSETHPEFPDARAAAHLVRALTHILPRARLDPEPLMKQATQIEHELRTLEAQLRERVGATPNETDPGVSMFR